MSESRDFDRAMQDWLAEGSDRTPEPAVDAVLLAIRTTPQERDLGIPWRFTHMPSYMRLAASIAVVAVVGAGAIWYLGRPPDIGSPGSSPTPSPAVAPSPTVGLTPSPTFTTQTLRWTPYTSEVYGFTTAYPPGWRVEQAATRRWDPALDVPLASAVSPAVDVFVNAAGSVAVTVWRVPADTEALANSREAVIAWVQEFCDSMEYYAPCDGIAERAIPMCRERRDCHPDAVIVPFNDDVLAVFVDPFDTLTVAQVLRGDPDPTTAEYGGSVRLLQAFLETMNVTVPAGQ